MLWFDTLPWRKKDTHNWQYQKAMVVKHDMLVPVLLIFTMHQLPHIHCSQNIHPAIYQSMIDHLRFWWRKKSIELCKFREKVGFKHRHPNLNLQTSHKCRSNAIIELKPKSKNTKSAVRVLNTFTVIEKEVES